MGSSKTADWKTIQTGKLLVCRPTNKVFRRYSELAVVKSVIYNSEFDVFWTDGNQSSHIFWTDPTSFELVDTETSTPGNWKKGARILCVFDSPHKWLTGTVVEDYQRGRVLQFTWDKDPKTIEDDYGELSSFLVFQQPIEGAPQTKPSAQIPVIASKELLTQPFVPEPVIDWDIYHGFKKNPKVKPYIIK